MRALDNIVSHHRKRRRARCYHLVGSARVLRIKPSVGRCLNRDHQNDAKKLVYATGGEHKPELPGMSELALVGGAPGAKVSVTILK